VLLNYQGVVWMWEKRIRENESAVCLVWAVPFGGNVWMTQSVGKLYYEKSGTYSAALDCEWISRVPESSAWLKQHNMGSTVINIANKAEFFCWISLLTSGMNSVTQCDLREEMLIARLWSCSGSGLVIIRIHKRAPGLHPDEILWHCVIEMAPILGFW